MHIFVKTLIFVLLIGISLVPSQVATVNLPDSIAVEGVEVIWVQQVISYCEGPAVDRDGILYFTEQKGNSVPNWPIWGAGKPQDISQCICPGWGCV